eukprot:CAMPEP_0198295978 /NCGR_PEP_ID=MMETSP1449-20131203/30364_1 /TAXON_ID=420275 /ORGANISM="Attheya septentrionalis, Strain CCMP2084" /LENGTH=280 /DNA_ID=CAMNT_0043996431 /DNA_START=26 /DNA_END=868 /DNA_ORIENTATION=-
MTTLKDQLGPLADLIGTWTSPQDDPTGLNVIAVPSPGSTPNDKGSFDLLTRPYRETLTFEVADPGARNRGGDVDQLVGAIAYKQQVFATDQEKEQLHVEVGMFLYLKNKNSVPADSTLIPAPTFSIARSATIPHGVSALLLGNSSESDGPPVIQMIDTKPILVPKVPAYTKVYRHSIGESPNQILVDAISKQKIVHTTSFSLDSDNEGQISNIPFITERANTPRVRWDMWLETVDNGDGTTTQQLQYSQNIDLVFHKQFNGVGTILWPHVTVNTLTKQCD